MLFRSVPPFSFGTCISRSYGSSYTGTYRFDTILTLLGGVYFERDYSCAEARHTQVNLSTLAL